jgi:hypothetical protein
MSIFSLKVLKRKPTKFFKIMPHLKLLKTYAFGTRKLKDKQKMQLI